MDVGIEERQVGIDERTNVMVIIETCVAARKESGPISCHCDYLALSLPELNIVVMGQLMDDDTRNNHTPETERRIGREQPTPPGETGV